jgi:hypothetical protein
LPAGASNNARVTWTSSNFARGLQWCWSHPSNPKNKKDSFLGLGCCVSYRPVWSSENVVQKEKKRKISGLGVPPNFAKFLGLAVPTGGVGTHLVCLDVVKCSLLRSGIHIPSPTLAAKRFQGVGNVFYPSSVVGTHEKSVDHS